MVKRTILRTLGANGLRSKAWVCYDTFTSKISKMLIVWQSLTIGIPSIILFIRNGMMFFYSFFYCSNTPFTCLNSFFFVVFRDISYDRLFSSFYGFTLVRLWSVAIVVSLFVSSFSTFSTRSIKGYSWLAKKSAFQFIFLWSRYRSNAPCLIGIFSPLHFIILSQKFTIVIISFKLY